MVLSANQVAELERRGVENVRVMVQMAGKFARSEMPLGATDGNPTREDVEAWLSQSEAAVARRHHKSKTRWTIVAAVVTGVSAGTAVLEALRWW